jgi:hypothetical protein
MCKSFATTQRYSQMQRSYVLSHGAYCTEAPYIEELTGCAFFFPRICVALLYIYIGATHWNIFIAYFFKIKIGSEKYFIGRNYNNSYFRYEERIYIFFLDEFKLLARNETLKGVTKHNLRVSLIPGIWDYL